MQFFGTLALSINHLFVGVSRCRSWLHRVGTVFAAWAIQLLLSVAHARLVASVTACSHKITELRAVYFYIHLLNNDDVADSNRKN